MVIGAIQAIKEAGLKPGKDILTGSIDGVPDIYKAMIDGEANASVELTPNMAGPAFDALEKYKKDGTMPEKLTPGKNLLNPSVRRISWCWSVVMVSPGVKRAPSRHDKTR